MLTPGTYSSDSRLQARTVKQSSLAARSHWTCQRFGLSPRKLAARIANRREPKIICVTLPKSGTHLLERALCLHPRLYRKIIPTIDERNIHRWGGLEALLKRLRPGQVLISHLHFRPEYAELFRSRDVKCLFLVRDPREVVVSQVFYLTAQRSHRHHRLFTALPDFKERLRTAIVGNDVEELPSIGQRLARFAGWLHASDYVVRFEDLIGPLGGGELAAQRRTLSSIYRAVGLEPSSELLDTLVERVFSTASPTFRTGGTRKWQRHFDGEHLRLFDKTVGDLLGVYGYASTTELQQ
jgi:hypothetical protein